LKLALLALLVPFTASAFEVSDVQVVREASGLNYQCAETWELGKPSYRATFSSGQASGQAVNLSLRVQFELCGGSDGHQSWSSRKPLEPTYNTDADGTLVRIEYAQPEFVFGSSFDSPNLQVLSVPNAPDQTLRLQLPFATGLSVEEKAALAAGRPVRVRAQLLYRARGTAFPSRGDSYQLGYQFGAAYTVFFTLKN
jgi:hypothetical protein